MKKRISYPIVLLLAAFLQIAQTATLTVNTEDNTDFTAGKTNLVRAINLLANGDTIAFNIPGAGAHYIQTPADGYPLITKNNVTIDGYTQPGASANTASIHAANNAQLRICLTSTNGNALSMQTACETSFGAAIPKLGYGDDEQAVLGFFHATNATIKGLAILSAPLTTTTIAPGTCKSICFAANSAENGGGQCQNWHISGCWFGVDPTTRQVAFMPDGVTVATPGIAIACYRTRNAAAPDNTVYNTPGTIGVAAGSANPRAEFNVIVTGYGFDAEGLDYRFSGNFWGVLPDGMTSADMSVLNGGAQMGDGFIEIGRSVNNCTIGTDGDGVNDADEGNVFGGMANGGGAFMDFYSSPHTNIVIAGNWFNLAVDGVTRFTNSAVLVDSFANTATVQFGSDFNGVSDSLEGNRVYNISNITDIFFNGSVGSLNPGVRMSFRGNSTVNNELLPYSYANGSGGRLNNFTNYEAPFMDPATNSVIPTLDPTSTSGHLKGTFALGTNGYNNISIDVYQLDQKGWDNGKVLGFSELTDSASYSNGFAQGSKYLGSKVVPNTGSFDIDISGMDLGGAQVTVTANYSLDPAGTTRGRVHTSDFSMPVNLAFVPSSAESVGLTRIVPDTLVWYSSSSGVTKIGGYVAGDDVTPGSSVEATAGVLGDSTFLLAAITRATNDDANMSFSSVLIPAAGGTPKLDNLFYTDAGTKWLKQINLSRQTGNPGRIGGDPRYGAVNYGGAGEVSLFAYPEFNSDGRWSNPFFNDALARACRSYGVQLHQLNPSTLASAPRMKAVDSMFGRLWTNSVAPTGGQDFGRTGSSPIGLDNGNFVCVGEDRTTLNNPSGRAAIATIFAPDGSIVKEAFMVNPSPTPDGSMWNSVGAFRGGFFVRPASGIIYFYDNAGNLQGTLNHNTASGLLYDTGRSDGTRMCSDIRSHYVFQAGKAPESGAFTNIMLTAYDANTRTWIANTIVSTEGNQEVTSLGSTRLLDRCNVACDAYNRVAVIYRLRPDRVAFTQDQVAARIFSFDGTKFTPLTPTFFPFIQHDSDPASLAGFQQLEPSVAMTPREIMFYAKGLWNGTANPTNPPVTAAFAHCYTILSHPLPVAAPRPTVTITKSGANLNLTWNPDDGLFTVQTRSSVTSGAWANATAGNVAPPVSIPAGAGPLYVRLAR